MSFSSNRKDALDPQLPLNHRASHARSCAMAVAEKYKVKRSVVLDLVQKASGVDLLEITNEREIETAIEALEAIRRGGLGSNDTVT
jgi:hypothetical protein